MKKLLLILALCSLSWTALQVQVVTLDNPYDLTATLGNWEIHNKYIAQVRLYNDGASAQNFNRVEANLDFDASKFELLSKSDKIPGWTATNFFIVTNGHVQYQRAANTGEPALNIPAGGYYVIYELTLRVKEVPVGTGTFNLDPNFTHALYNITDLTGTLSNLLVNIVLDITPPTTQILPAPSLHYASVQNIVLQVDPNPNTNCSDIREIRYTLDGSTPNWTSPVYVAPLVASENQITTIKWYGLDQNYNPESVQAAQYQVDTIKPVITDVFMTPTPALVRKDAVLDIYFTAVDEIALANTSVSIGGSNAGFISQSGANYHYQYTVSETGDQTKIITVRATDHAGNQITDTSQSVQIDNTPPTFNIVFIDPTSANVGTEVTFEFTASETLDVYGSTVNIGLNSPATLVSETGLNYRFQRVLDGSETSGWIMIYGRDLAGNVGYNLDGNNVLKITGKDLVGNSGETVTTINIRY